MQERTGSVAAPRRSRDARRRAALALVMAIAGAACGQKGPLVLPAANAVVAPASAAAVSAPR